MSTVLCNGIITHPSIVLNSVYLSDNIERSPISVSQPCNAHRRFSQGYFKRLFWLCIMKVASHRRDEGTLYLTRTEHGGWQNAVHNSLGAKAKVGFDAEKVV